MSLSLLQAPRSQKNSARVFVTHGIHPSAGVPLYVPWKYKWPVGCIVFTIAGSAYMITNHYPWSQPRLLPMTSLDTAIPFLPWTVWIYWSLFLFIPVTYFLNRCVISLNKHLYSFFLLVATSCFIFILYPTSYPRELYPLQPSTLPANFFPLEFLRSLDKPHNCFPSLHVSVSTLIALGFLDDQQKHFSWVALWAVLLSLSTLTTKQHYILDVASGAFLGAFFYVIFHRWISFRWSETEADTPKSKSLNAVDPR